MEFPFSFIFFSFTLPIKKQKYVWKIFYPLKDRIASPQWKNFQVLSLSEIWAAVTLSWYKTEEFYCKYSALMQSKSYVSNKFI